MPDQPKAYHILLRPLGDKKLRREIKLARRYKEHPSVHYYRENLPELEAKLSALESQMQPRELYADMVKVIDDGSMLIGIDPGNRVYVGSFARSGHNHAKGLRIKRNNPEFYDIKHTAPGVDPHDPSHTDYIITRKFKKILSVNLDNVISVNGKPVIGGMRGLDKGVQHLGLDEEWSVDNVSDLLDE